jgi:hypothetical protein
MPLTYNGEPIPTSVRADRVISAFENGMDDTRLDYWREQDLCDFTPISGYPSIIDDSDIGNYFMTGEEITEAHVDQSCRYVTDGHHRTTVLLERHVRRINVVIDPSCFTVEAELIEYRKETQQCKPTA